MSGIVVVSYLARVTPEARSAEDTETSLEERRYEGDVELHQRLDPRRILKRIDVDLDARLVVRYTRGSIRGGY